MTGQELGTLAEAAMLAGDLADDRLRERHAQRDQRSAASRSGARQRTVSARLARRVRRARRSRRAARRDRRRHRVRAPAQARRALSADRRRGNATRARAHVPFVSRDLGRLHQEHVPRRARRSARDRRRRRVLRGALRRAAAARAGARCGAAQRARGGRSAGGDAARDGGRCSGCDLCLDAAPARGLRAVRHRRCSARSRSTRRAGRSPVPDFAWRGPPIIRTQRTNARDDLRRNDRHHAARHDGRNHRARQAPRLHLSIERDLRRHRRLLRLRSARRDPQAQRQGRVVARDGRTARRRRGVRFVDHHAPADVGRVGPRRGVSRQARRLPQLQAPLSRRPSRRRSTSAPTAG